MIYDGSFNGLSWGPTKDIVCAKMDGLTGSPPYRAANVQRMGQHGSFMGRNTYGDRIVTLTLNLIPNRTGSGSTLDSLCQQLEQALVIQQQGAVPLVLDGGTKQLNCQPVIWDVPRSPANAKERYGIATVQFRAADPIIYDAAATSVGLFVFVPSGGWTFPWTFPWTFSTGAIPSTVTAYNQGSIETGPIFRVVGPFDVGFNLRNLTTGGLLAVNMVMRATDWVDIDMSAETVMFQSFSNRRNAVVQGTDFWKMVPGPNTIQMSSLGTIGPATASMTFRSAYISLRA